MKNKRLAIISLALILILLFSGSALAYDNQFTICESSASSYCNTNLRETANTDINLLSKKLALNSKFDLREYISIKVKDQQSTNFCWTFSINSILETNLLLTQNESIDFSERFLQYAASRYFKNNQINEDGVKEVTAGGSQYMGLKYYSAGIGPVLEEDMPFENNMDLIELSEIQNKETVKQIDSYVVFPFIYKEKENGVVKYKYEVANSKEKKEYTKEELAEVRNSIKEHIVQYGGISARTCISKGEYFNNQENMGTSTAYYCGVAGTKPDHAVTIIGWDDNYAVTNFNENNRPTSPGAYLVLNSHGENLYDNGCFYISYEDVNIEELCLGVTSVSDVNYEKIHQYEKDGPLEGNIHSDGSNECKIGNIFKIDANDKYLTQVSFSIRENTEVQITAQIDGKEILIQSNKLYEKAGFYTVKLTNPIELHGDTLVVYLKVKKENVVIPVESAKSSENVTANKGESVYSIGNSGWRDLAEDVKGNFCIKAFTSSSLETQDNPADDNPDNPPDDNPDNPSDDNSDNPSDDNPDNPPDDNPDNPSDDNSDNPPDDNPDNPSDDNPPDDNPDNPPDDNPPDTSKYPKGDVNQNGVVDMLDIIKICKHILETEILTEEKFELADTNSDGKVNALDIIRVIKIILES